MGNQLIGIVVVFLIYKFLNYCWNKLTKILKKERKR